MLEDRDYMRQPEYHDSGWRARLQIRWSWTVILLAMYWLVFLTGLATNHFFPQNHFFHGYEILTGSGFEYTPGYLPLSLVGLEHGYLWQLVTYQFMHEGFWHIFLNSWAIYFFGLEMEEALGGKRFLALVFSSGIAGGVLQMLTALVWPQYFGGAVVGASACGFGLIAAYALMFPDRELRLLLLFVIPVTIRARTLLIGCAVLALAGFAFHGIIMPHVAHAAHLGGMAMGCFFVRYIVQGRWSRLGGTMQAAGKIQSPSGHAEPPEEKSTDTYVANEVVPILDKISAHGIQSLTRQEREVLEAVRKQINRP